MSGQAESSNPELVGVERPAIEWLKTLGYQHIKGRDVEQTHKTEPVILESVLTDRLHALTLGWPRFRTVQTKRSNSSETYGLSITAT